MNKNSIALFLVGVGLTCLPGGVAGNDGKREGSLQPFIGEPRMEMQQVFRNERFPNIVVTLKGTVIVTWGNNSIRARRSEDGGNTWGDEIVIAKPLQRTLPCSIVASDSARKTCQSDSDQKQSD